MVECRNTIILASAEDIGMYHVSELIGWSQLFRDKCLRFA
jgi:hypothetical protein